MCVDSSVLAGQPSDVRIRKGIAQSPKERQLQQAIANQLSTDVDKDRLRFVGRCDVLPRIRVIRLESSP